MIQKGKKQISVYFHGISKVNKCSLKDKHFSLFFIYFRYTAIKCSTKTADGLVRTADLGAGSNCSSNYEILRGHC